MLNRPNLMRFFFLKAEKIAYEGQNILRTTCKITHALSLVILEKPKH